MDIFPGEIGTEGTYVRLYCGTINASIDCMSAAGMVLWSGPWVMGSSDVPRPGRGRVMAFELVPGRDVSWPKALLVLKPWVNGGVLHEIGACWDVIAKDHVGLADSYVWPTLDFAPTNVQWPAGLPMPNI